MTRAKAYSSVPTPTKINNILQDGQALCTAAQAQTTIAASNHTFRERLAINLAPGKQTPFADRFVIARAILACEGLLPSECPRA